MTLETADDSVMPDHFFFSALGKSLVSVEQVFDYTRHFCGEFPIFFLLSWSFLHFDGVLIEVGAAFFLNPCKRFFIFRSVVNAFGHSADNFHFVNRFNSHAEIFFKEFGADYRAADTHRNRTDLQIRFTSHRGNRYSRSRETEHFFLHVGGNGSVVRFLNLVSVNAECGQAFLRVGC